MKIFDQTDLVSENNVSTQDLDVFFNVYLDQRDKYVYNLNNTLYIKVPDEITDIYIVKHDQFWTTLSYNIYGTTRLAWLLMKLNNVRCENVFSIIETGTRIRYLNKDYVSRIIREMR